MKRLIEELVETDVFRSEIVQREETGSRTVMRFQTYLNHTLEKEQAKPQDGARGKYGQYSRARPSYCPPVTPGGKRRGRPPNPDKPRPTYNRGYVPPGGDDEEDHNVDACLLCGLGGYLICCEGCPAAFHVKCCGENRHSVKNDGGQWLCEECRLKDAYWSDDLHKNLMRLKKTRASSVQKRTTWQIQEFAFCLSISDSHDSYDLHCDWTCKVLPVRHRITNKVEVKELMTTGYKKNVIISYNPATLNDYRNKFSSSWFAFSTELLSRSKRVADDAGVFHISKYEWSSKFGRGQKAPENLVKALRNDHANLIVVFLKNCEKELYGLLEGNWARYPAWRTQWISAVLHSETIYQLCQRLLELESSLMKEAYVPGWFQASSTKDMTKKMQADPTTDVRAIQRRIVFRLQEHKVGIYCDFPGMILKFFNYRQVHRPYPSRLFHGEHAHFFWWRDKSYAPRSPRLTKEMQRKVARQGGVTRIPGFLYPNTTYAVPTKQQLWRVRVEKARTVSQLAFLVRDLSANIRWDSIRGERLETDEDKQHDKLIVVDSRTAAATAATAAAPSQSSQSGYAAGAGAGVGVTEFLCGYPPEDKAFEEGTEVLLDDLRDVAWRSIVDIPLKKVKDFYESRRIAHVKTGRHFLRMEDLSSYLEGLDVTVYWPESGKWFAAKLEDVTKDRGLMLAYPNGNKEFLDLEDLRQLLINEEIAVDYKIMKELKRSSERRAQEQRTLEIKTARAEEKERLKRVKEKEKHRTELTQRDVELIKLLNKTILDSCLRISTGRDTSKGKKSKVEIASMIPRDVLTVLLSKAESGELKPFCLEGHKPSDEDIEGLGIERYKPKLKVPASMAGMSPDQIDMMQNPLYQRGIKTYKESKMTRPKASACIEIMNAMCEVEGVTGEKIATAFVHLPERSKYPLYYKIITSPVDIGSIRMALKRTKTNTYETLEDFVSDVELMWSNAHTFNTEDAPVCGFAKDLQEWFWQKMTAQFPHVTSENWLARKDAVAQLPSEVFLLLTTRGGKGGGGKGQGQDGEGGSKGKEAALKAKKQKALSGFRAINRLAIALGVVKDIMKLPDSFPFHYPVDTRIIPKYAEVVEKPMDLGTIVQELEMGKASGWIKVSYKFIEEVYDDVKLVFSNCR